MLNDSSPLGLERSQPKLSGTMECSRRDAYKKNKMFLIDHLLCLTVLKAFTALAESLHILRDTCKENKEVGKKIRESKKGNVIIAYHVP